MQVGEVINHFGFLRCTSKHTALEVLCCQSWCGTQSKAHVRRYDAMPLEIKYWNDWKNLECGALRGIVQMQIRPFFADEIAEVASISTLVFGMALGFTSPAIDVMQDTLKVNGKAASVPSDLVTLQSTNLRDVMEIRCDKF